MRQTEKRRGGKRARKRERGGEASATARAVGGSERVSASVGGRTSAGMTALCFLGAEYLAPAKPRATRLSESASAEVDTTRYCARAPTHYLYHGLSDNGFPRIKSGEAHDSTDTSES